MAVTTQHGQVLENHIQRQFYGSATSTIITTTADATTTSTTIVSTTVSNNNNEVFSVTKKFLGLTKPTILIRSQNNPNDVTFL
jgi:hypothetical protein